MHRTPPNPPENTLFTSFWYMPTVGPFHNHSIPQLPSSLTPTLNKHTPDHHLSWISELPTLKPIQPVPPQNDTRPPSYRNTLTLPHFPQHSPASCLPPSQTDILLLYVPDRWSHSYLIQPLPESGATHTLSEWKSSCMPVPGQIEHNFNLNIVILIPSEKEDAFQSVWESRICSHTWLLYSSLLSRTDTFHLPLLHRAQWNVSTHQPKPDLPPQIDTFPSNTPKSHTLSLRELDAALPSLLPASLYFTNLRPCLPDSHCTPAFPPCVTYTFRN